MVYELQAQQLADSWNAEPHCCIPHLRWYLMTAALTISSNIVGGRSNLLDQAGSNVLELILELDGLGHSDSIFSDFRPPIALLYDNIPALQQVATITVVLSPYFAITSSLRGVCSCYKLSTIQWQTYLWAKRDLDSVCQAVNTAEYGRSAVYPKPDLLGCVAALEGFGPGLQ